MSNRRVSVEVEVELVVGRRDRCWWKRLRRTPDVVVVVGRVELLVLVVVCRSRRSGIALLDININICFW